MQWALPGVFQARRGVHSRGGGSHHEGEAHPAPVALHRPIQAPPAPPQGEEAAVPAQPQGRARGHRQVLELSAPPRALLFQLGGGLPWEGLKPPQEVAGAGLVSADAIVALGRFLCSSGLSGNGTTKGVVKTKVLALDGISCFGGSKRMDSAVRPCVEQPRLVPPLGLCSCSPAQHR